MATFIESTEYNRALHLINYYRFINIPMRYSAFIKLTKQIQEQILSSLQVKEKIHVRILSFTLMPNHFHFILEQITTGGISKFMADFTNSYTRYVNTKKHRPGPLFQGRFKSIIIRSEEQLVHLSRYQHLNPLTDDVISSFNNLIEYPYSSLCDYIGKQQHDFVDTELILSHFKNKQRYHNFMVNQVDYQRKLATIKKLILE